METQVGDLDLAPPQDQAVIASCTRQMNDIRHCLFRVEQSNIFDLYSSWKQKQIQIYPHGPKLHVHAYVLHYTCLQMYELCILR